ncbi:MAG: response regulator [Ignavibacteriaceae bacterium]
MKFLILDENPGFRKFIKKLITANNDECIQTENSPHLKSALKKYQPDWIVIDINLKKENAFQVAREIRRENPAIKIALLSDFDDVRLRKKAKEAGATAFISKENLTDFYKIL